MSNVDAQLAAAAAAAAAAALHSGYVGADAADDDDVLTALALAYGPPPTKAARFGTGTLGASLPSYKPAPRIDDVVEWYTEDTTQWPSSQSATLESLQPPAYDFSDYPATPLSPPPHEQQQQQQSPLPLPQSPVGTASSIDTTMYDSDSDASVSSPSSPSPSSDSDDVDGDSDSDSDNASRRRREDWQQQDTRVCTRSGALTAAVVALRAQASAALLNNNNGNEIQQHAQACANYPRFRQLCAVLSAPTVRLWHWTGVHSVTGADEHWVVSRGAYAGADGYWFVNRSELSLLANGDGAARGVVNLQYGALSAEDPVDARHWRTLSTPRLPTRRFGRAECARVRAVVEALLRRHRFPFRSTEALSFNGASVCVRLDDVDVDGSDDDGDGDGDV